MRRTLSLVLSLLAARHAGAATYRHTVTIHDAVGNPESSFGAALAGIGGSRIVVGSPSSNGASTQVFDTTSGALVDTLPTPATASPSFGAALATASGDAFVGDPSADDPDSPSGAFVGAVFRIKTSTGELGGTLLSPSPVMFGRFGARLAILDGRLLVTESRAAYAFDPASGALLATYPAPTEASTEFGAAIAGLDGLVAVGDPGADRVFVYDLATGTLLRTLAHAVASEAGRFGHALAAIDHDLLVGAPTANAGSGAVYRLELVGGMLRTTFANPAPDGDGFGNAVAVFGDAVAIGAPFDDVVESGLTEGAVHLFTAETARLIAVLGRPSPDYLDAFGLAVTPIGAQLFAGAPHEDTVAVEGFTLDCRGTTECKARNVAMTNVRTRVVGANGMSVRARLDLGPDELDAVAAGGQLELLGTPDVVGFGRWGATSCVHEGRRLTCAAPGVNLVMTRARRGSGRLVATLSDLYTLPRPDAALVARLLTADGGSRAGRMRACRGAGLLLHCR